MKKPFVVSLLLSVSTCRAFASPSWVAKTHTLQYSTLRMSLLVSHVQSLDIDVKLILASQSPRRREILDMMGLGGKYTACPSPLDESSLQQRLQNEDPKVYTRFLAEAKAKALAETLTTSIPTLVLGSDTIVDLGGKILEKPSDSDAAVGMLRQLSARFHQVHTGVAIYIAANNEIQLFSSFTDTANVLFADLSEEDIHAYVKTGEPMDKAGAYGIQAIGGQFVVKVEGDFFTVMGLPMHRVSAELARAIQTIIANEQVDDTST